MKEEVRILVLKCKDYQDKLLSFNIHSEGKAELNKEQTEKLVENLSQVPPLIVRNEELYFVEVNNDSGRLGKGYITADNSFGIIELIENLVN